MVTKTAVTKREPVGDRTRTKRAKASLVRLKEAHGKRLLVDLDAAAREALEALMAAGYEQTQRAVVRKALLRAAARLRK